MTAVAIDERAADPLVAIWILERGQQSPINLHSVGAMKPGNHILNGERDRERDSTYARQIVTIELKVALIDRIPTTHAVVLACHHISTVVSEDIWEDTVGGCKQGEEEVNESREHCVCF